MDGSKLSAYKEGAGIVRREVWSIQIKPEENKIEIFTKEDEEPEVKQLDEFLEEFDKKIELLNQDYLDYICEEDDSDE